MKKDWFGWQTHRLPCPARVVRWGHHGKPVLLFPTAGGDCEEVERQGLIGALAGLIDAGRIKVYSIDSVAGTALDLAAALPRILFAGPEPLPRLRVPGSRAADPQRLRIGRHRDHRDRRVHRRIQRRGDVVPSPGRLLDGAGHERHVRPVALPAGPHVRRLLLLLAAAFPAEPRARAGSSTRCDGASSCSRRDRGAGKIRANPGASPACSGSKGIPNRVDDWGPGVDHDWPTWLAMLPKYLSELA